MKNYKKGRYLSNNGWNEKLSFSEKDLEELRDKLSPEDRNMLILMENYESRRKKRRQ